MLNNTNGKINESNNLIINEMVHFLIIYFFRYKFPDVFNRKIVYISILKGSLWGAV